VVAKNSGFRDAPFARDSHNQQISPADPDAAIRQAAFAHVKRLTDASGVLTANQLRDGFEYQGRRIPLINPQRGIFKPKQMTFLLSIKTVFPRPGRKVWYDDQRLVHQQIYAGDEGVDYAFMGTDPQAADNRWLRDAMLNGVPVIYFLGVAPGVYQALAPTFITDWDAHSLKARLAFGDVTQFNTVFPEATTERRYALRLVKQRLHQATFREAVIQAYNGRCALSGLPEPLLLDAAHIIADKDERFGQPVIPNGLPLSKIHHAAFDAHLIGIDPDYKIHVSPKLLSLNDGPTLESLKSLQGKQLRLPARKQDFPDKERLEQRFRLFQAAA
jgi:putative restriction endonuclease